MEKLTYRFVYNRKHRLNGRGEALVQVEAYLFCCYTGLRYSDFTALTCDNFVEEGAETWLQFKTVKTGEAVRLPLNHLFEGKALRLYERHRSRPEDLFHLRSERDANRRLGAIAGMAGITKHLTFHTARHTFATLLIYKGALITSVQKLLGHRRVTTTEHYAEVLPEGIVKDLERCEGSGYGRRENFIQQNRITVSVNTIFRFQASVSKVG